MCSARPDVLSQSQDDIHLQSTSALSGTNILSLHTGQHLLVANSSMMHLLHSVSVCHRTERQKDRLTDHKKCARTW